MSKVTAKFRDKSFVPSNFKSKFDDKQSEFRNPFAEFEFTANKLFEENADLCQNLSATTVYRGSQIRK